MSSENKVAKQNQDQDQQAAIEDAANMNVGARFVNHLLTPGSALSGTMQTAFNAIMVILFMTWGIFLGSMPDSIHVWIFGFLIFGLTLSTNWFLGEVIKMKEEGKLTEEDAAAAAATDDEKKELEDNKSDEEKKVIEEKKEKKNDDDATVRQRKNNNKDQEVKEENNKKSSSAAQPSPKKSTKRQSKKET